MSERSLLAKSRKNECLPETLLSHTRKVIKAVGLLFDEGSSATDLGEKWLRFFKIIEKEDVRLFLACTKAAAAAHDWGKANSGFQAVVWSDPNSIQSIRHEHLGALMLLVPEVDAWITTGVGIDHDIVFAAIVGHHLKATYESVGMPLPGSGPAFRLFSSHAEFHELLEIIRAEFGVSSPLKSSAIREVWSFSAHSSRQHIEPLRTTVQDRLYRIDRALEGDERRRRILWGVRAALIAADAVASADLRLGKPLEQWIRDAFDPGKLCTSNYVRKEIIQPRIAELTQSKHWNPNNGRGGWTDFQDDAAGLPSRALLLAPCGSGKTLAAWRWIESQLAARPTARVLFLIQRGRQQQRASATMSPGRQKQTPHLRTGRPITTYRGCLPIQLSRKSQTRGGKSTSNLRKSSSPWAFGSGAFLRQRSISSSRSFNTNMRRFVRSRYWLTPQSS